MGFEACYIQFVNKGKLADYFERNFLQYQMSHGRMSLAAMAKELGFSRSFLSQLMNGISTSMTYHKAVFVAGVFNDYSIMDILGYKAPVDESELETLPPRLRSALLESRDRIIEAGVSGDSKEAESILIETMAKFGYNLTSQHDDESAN